MMNSQVICSLALEIYFCNGHRNAVSFNTIFLICVSTLFRYIGISKKNHASLHYFAS